MKSLTELKEKLRTATPELQTCKILKPGDYEFSVREAQIEYDQKRHYEYLYLRLDVGERATSDRFPFVENMLWKLFAFLAAVGLDADSWSDTKQLVGRSGKLKAETEDGKTYYRYLQADAEGEV